MVDSKRHFDRTRRAIVGLALAVLAVPAVQAQLDYWEGPAAVAVEVRGDDGKPVEGALVTLRVADRTPPQGPAPVTTDERGRVVIGNLGEFEWYIEVQHDSYMLYAAYLKLKAGKKPVVGFSSQVNTADSWTPMRVKFAKAKSEFTKKQSKQERIAERQSADVERSAAQARPEARQPAPPTPEAPPAEAPPAAVAAPVSGQAAREEPIASPPATTTPSTSAPRQAPPAPAPATMPEEKPEEIAAQPAEVEPADVAEPEPDLQETDQDAAAALEAEATAAALEADRLAAERAEAERLATEQAEAEKLAEQSEAERVAAEQAEAERLAAEQREAERIAAEQAAAAALEAERIAAEQADRDAETTAALEAEKLAAQQQEAERLAAEQQAAERLATEQAEAERLAAEEATAAALEADRVAAEEDAAQQLEADRIAAEEDAARQLEAERLAAEEDAAQQLEAERLAAEEAEREAAAAAALAADRLAAEQAEAEKLAAEPTAPTGPRPIPSYMTSADLGTCPACKPGEWSMYDQETVASARDIGTEDCPGDAEAIAEGIRLLIEAVDPAFAGPISAALTPSRYAPVGREDRAAIRERLSRYLQATSTCRLVGILLPPGSTFAGYQYEAWGAAGGGACVAGMDCPVGRARWEEEPIFVEGPVTAIYALFHNRSTRHDRRARFTVYFVPPSRDWAP